MKTPKELRNPIVRATIRHFAEIIRDAGVSPNIREIEVALAVEQLRDEHGLRLTTERLNALVDHVGERRKSIFWSFDDESDNAGE